MSDHILWNVNAEDLVQAVWGSKECRGSPQRSRPRLAWSQVGILGAVTSWHLSSGNTTIAKIGKQKPDGGFCLFSTKLIQTDYLLEIIGWITPIFEKDRKENPGNYRLWHTPLCLTAVKGGLIDIISLDFCKAFNMMSHAIFVSKFIWIWRVDFGE